MINVLINGINGKMGSIVADLVDENDNMLVFGGVDKNSSIDCEYRLFTNFDEILEKPDVIIDFSTPIATFAMLEYAKKNSIPTVVATTGFNDEELDRLTQYANYIPLFKSANMSYDVNLMAKLVSNLAVVLNDVDIEIVETHHNRKIDSPSGTAILLADKINEATNNKYTYEFNRHNKHEKRNKNEIGFSSVRGGNIVGEHSVLFLGEDETLEIKHTSYSRKVFAQGALKAAEFIVSKPIGFYNMDNMV